MGQMRSDQLDQHNFNWNARVAGCGEKTYWLGVLVAKYQGVP